MKIRRAFADGRFGQIHYRSAGPATAEQTPVVCLHMSPKSGRSFEALMPLLGADRLVIAPDYPGYGESDPPPEDPPVGVGDYAEAAWSVVDALGLGAVDFFGLHTGALVAVEAARRRPAQARRLVLVSAPLPTPQELDALRAFYEPIALDEAGTRYRVMWERIARFRGPEMTLEMMARSFAENLRGGEAYEWGHRAAFAYLETDFRAALIAASTRITIFNAHDDLYEMTARAQPLVPPGRYIEQPDWGHGFLDARPGEVAQALRAVL